MISEPMDLHEENVRHARAVALKYGCTVTIWQDGKLEHVRTGDPTSCPEAAVKGWHWLTIVRARLGV